MEGRKEGRKEGGKERRPRERWKEKKKVERKEKKSMKFFFLLYVFCFDLNGQWTKHYRYIYIILLTLI